MKSETQSVRFLLVLVVYHFLVDAIASTINPLWPVLQQQTSATDQQFFWLFLSWNVATSASQIVFGLWGDRAHHPWLIWVGPALAAICLSMLGYAATPISLALMVSASGLGIAAFHPEAASQAGNCLVNHRSRALSLFQLGGFLGQSVGPYFGGYIVKSWGMKGLLPGLGWSLFAVLFFGSLLKLGNSAPREVKFAPVPWKELFRGQILKLSVLLLVGVFRLVPAAGVPMAIAFLESERKTNTADIGLLQSAFMFGIGGGGLICGMIVRKSQERMLLWGLPLAAAPLVWLIPGASREFQFLLCTGAGILLGITIPILISLGQQLLPQSQRVGSSITMGLSWGLGAGLAGLIVMTLKPIGQIEQGFSWFASAAIVSSVLCCWLPTTCSVVSPDEIRS